MNEADRKKQVLKIARYMGCRGAHKNEKGEWEWEVEEVTNREDFINPF